MRSFIPKLDGRLRLRMKKDANAQSQLIEKLHFISVSKEGY
jgi:hypothetical protein